MHEQTGGTLVSIDRENPMLYPRLSRPHLRYRMLMERDTLETDGHANLFSGSKDARGNSAM